MALELLPLGYGWVLFFSVVISVLCLATGFAAGSVRKKVFNKAFFEEHFPTELKSKQVDHSGYPDMGSGLYSQKLSHADWKTFNNAQRAHYNFIEGLPLILIVGLVSGLVYTRLTVLCQISYAIGRVFYSYGYKTSGPNGRLIGALLLDVALLLLIGSSLCASWSLAGGLDGLTHFILGQKA